MISVKIAAAVKTVVPLSDKPGSYSLVVRSKATDLGTITGGHVVKGLPGLGGYLYGSYSPYTHARHIGIDIEVGCNTRIFLPVGWHIAGWGVNGAIGHFLLLREDSTGYYVWLGHLNRHLTTTAAPWGALIALSGSPETSGGFGHGCHLYMAYTRGLALTWSDSIDPVLAYNRMGAMLFGLTSAGARNRAGTKTERRARSLANSHGGPSVPVSVGPAAPDGYTRMMVGAN